MKLLSLQEVAKRLGIPYLQARVLVVEGAIPSVKVGPRGIRVKDEDLGIYLEENRKGNKNNE